MQRSRETGRIAPRPTNVGKIPSPGRQRDGQESGRTPRASRNSGTPSHIQANSDFNHALIDAIAGDTNNRSNPYSHLPASVWSNLDDLADNPSATPHDIQGIMGQLAAPAQKAAQQVHFNDVTSHFKGMDPKLDHLIDAHSSAVAGGLMTPEQGLQGIMNEAKSFINQKQQKEQDQKASAYQERRLKDLDEQYKDADTAVTDAEKPGGARDTDLNEYNALLAQRGAIQKQREAAENTLPGAPGQQQQQPAPPAGQNPQSGPPLAQQPQGQPQQPGQGQGQGQGQGPQYQEGQILHSPSTGQVYHFTGGKLMLMNGPAAQPAGASPQPAAAPPQPQQLPTIPPATYDTGPNQRDSFPNPNNYPPSLRNL